MLQVLVRGWQGWLPATPVLRLLLHGNSYCWRQVYLKTRPLPEGAGVQMISGTPALMERDWVLGSVGCAAAL